MADPRPMLLNTGDWGGEERSQPREVAARELRGKPEGVEPRKPREERGGQLCQALSRVGMTERCSLDLTAQRSLVTLRQAVDSGDGIQEIKGAWVSPLRHCCEEEQRRGSGWRGSRADRCFGGSGNNLRVMLMARSPQKESLMTQQVS